MKISNDIVYVGVNDRKTDLFEGQYAVPNGISYNSYLIVDDKIAVIDSVSIDYAESWLENVRAALGDRTPDYIVVHHMEPDHSGSLVAFLSAYPNAQIVASAKAFDMMKAFYGTKAEFLGIKVKEGDVLELGAHRLTFISAPMVHWPEVMVSYDEKDKVLFSADGFGKFGDLDTDEDWDDEARRYYIGIVGKYGAQVRALLKKAESLDIRTICPLHGPVLSENIDRYIGLYMTWSGYEVEKEGVVIAYTTVYGQTKAAAELIYKGLVERGVEAKLYDLARCDTYAAVADAFKYSKLVLATTTYNGTIFPFMKHFISHLTERSYQSRTVAFVENGTWGPLAKKVMMGMLEGCKDLTFAENSVKIYSALNDSSLADIDRLIEEICK